MTATLLPNYVWIKFPINYLDDPDFMKLTDYSVGVFVKLYLLAARSDAGGLLCNQKRSYTQDELAWHLRVHADVLSAAIGELKEMKFLEEENGAFSIANFMAEQGPGDNVKRAQWRERQRKHREKLDFTEHYEEKEGEKEKEKDSDKDRDKEQNREDKKSHGDITVKSSDTTTAPDGASKGYAISQAFASMLNMRAREQADVTPDIGFLFKCAHTYGNWALQRGEDPENIDLVIDLYLRRASLEEFMC